MSATPAWRDYGIFRRRIALAVALITCAASAQATNRSSKVSASRPAGFEALLKPQETVTDVFVGGRAAGQTRVRYSSGKITLLDIDSVMELLPDVIEPASVRAVLSAPDLDSHTSLICPPDRDAFACGVYRPAVAGVIFDEQLFRLDIFVNPRLLAVHPAVARDYLPRPTSDLSLVDQLGGSVAGSGDAVDYGLQNRAILGKGEARIRNDLSYSSTFGLSIDALLAELDKPGLRYSVGAMWVPGIELIGRRHLVGIGVQSQIDTRLDRNVIAGTPLIVSLPLRSRVDILRDGRLLTSRTYDAGNQTLDTATLPDGAYEVVLHIQEAGGTTRDERRFFTKDAAIATIGEPIFFADVGMLGEDRRGAPLATTRTPLYQAGVARRFSPHVALDATLMGTDKTALIELGGYWLSPAAQVRLAGLASIHGDAGVLLQANSSGLSRLNYNIDARRVWSRNDRPLIPLGNDGNNAYDISIDRTAQLAAGSFTQIAATISYTLKPGLVGVTASYRDDPREGRTYAIGPSVYWPLVERAGVQVNLRGDMTLTNHGRTAFIGLTFQRIRAHSAITANLGARTTSGAGDGNGTAVIGGVGGSWQRDHVLGGTASVAVGAEQDVESTVVRTRADLNTARASIYADVAQPVAGNDGATQYSVNFQTTAAITSGGIAFQGREQQDSVIMVGVDGVTKGTPFEVLIDNAPRGIVRAGGHVSIAVPAYRQYAVSLRSISADIVRLDGGTRMVSVYPGNVSRLAWSAQLVIAMFGRIAWPDGTPVADAAVYVPGALGGTDDNGYFQIEAGTDTVLKVQLAGGRTCQLPLHAHLTAQGFASLGTLVCSQALSTTRIATFRP